MKAARTRMPQRLSMDSSCCKVVERASKATREIRNRNRYRIRDESSTFVWLRTVVSGGAIHLHTVDASKRKDGSCSHVRTYVASGLLFMKIHVMLHASLALANPVFSPPFFSPLATILAVLFPPLPAGILFFSNTSGRVRFHRNTQKRRTTLLCAYAITPHAYGAYAPRLWTGLLCISIGVGTH